MSLSCSCYHELEPGDIRWDWPSDYSTLQTKRTRKCVSCDDKIGIGDVVAQFLRYKVPEYQIEINIYGEDTEHGPPRATHYHCERCADLMFSLLELGFDCISIYDDMRRLVKDYSELYGKH